MKIRLAVAVALLLFGAGAWVLWVKRGSPPGKHGDAERAVSERAAREQGKSSVSALLRAQPQESREARGVQPPDAATTKVDWAAVTNFNYWASSWVAANRQEREAMKEEG